MKSAVTTIGSAVLSLALFGCGDREATPTPAGADANVVEVTARGLQFEAPDEIASGWTTFRFTNASTMIHFAVVERLPEGIGIADQQAQVAPVFQEGLNLLNAGEPEAAMEEFGKLPDWFSQIVFLGGPGLTSPGRTSEATVYLEPGAYLLECYVKTNGVFHSYNPSPPAYGMVREFTVSDAASGAAEPAATLEITLSSARGIEVQGEPAAGEQTVAVHFEDQRTHENFVGHDVHVVRLTEDTDLEALATWMDWSKPEGLETPAPAEFIGGTNEMPAGETAYFTVQLEPGRYAWIAEVTAPDEKAMLKTFVVSPDDTG